MVVLAALGGLWLHPQGVLSFAVPWDMEKVSLTLTLSPPPSPFPLPKCLFYETAPIERVS